MRALDDREVEDHAKGRIISDAPLSRPVPVDLRYDPGFSPATVRFVFPGDVEWSFPAASWRPDCGPRRVAAT